MKAIYYIVGSTVIKVSEVPDGTTDIAYAKLLEGVLSCDPLGGNIWLSKDGDSEPWYRRDVVEKPTAICTDLIMSELFVWDEHADHLCGLRIQSEVGRRLFGERAIEHVRSLKKDMMCPPSLKDSICCIPDGMLVASPSRHVILRVAVDSTMETFMGGNRSGFTISTPLRFSLLSFPSGVAYDDKSEMVFVADTGNGVLRIFDLNRSPNMHAVIGSPGARCLRDGGLDKACFVSPSCMRSKNGRIVVIDDSRHIREIDFMAKTVRTLHSSEKNVHSISLDNKGQVYFLEDV